LNRYISIIISVNKIESTEELNKKKNLI